MRNRIQQLAKGRFEYGEPAVSFSEDKIVIEVLENADYSGSFSINCQGREEIRGVIYSTNARMECLTPQFAGSSVTVRYCFHGKGLREGDICEGSFVIVCSQCEYNLSFAATVSRAYPEASTGVLHNLTDFTNLAKANWDEAYQLFYHKNFVSLLPEESRESMLYRGITAGRPSNQSMEEFLVSTRKKGRISIALYQPSVQFQNVWSNTRESIGIRKDSWGYVNIQVSSDAGFIRLGKQTLTTEDFIGSGCMYSYYIDVTMLHAGHNYGRIFFETPYQKIEYRITVSNPGQHKYSEIRRQIKEYKVGLAELYQAYRLKKIVTGVWANETIDILDHLHALCPNETLYVLMKAQAYIINRQRQEAEWILEEFRRSWPDEKHPLWGYYLYLLTLLEREPVYVDRMTLQIKAIFRENPDSDLLFWVLTFLEEKYYNNSMEKLKAISYWVMQGCTSPYMYLEAYYILEQDPYLLRRFGQFELRILRWAMRNHALSKDVVLQIFELLQKEKLVRPVIYRLACEAYEVMPVDEHLRIMCSYLIKGQKFDGCYHKWYVMGIEKELRITGLYEAYLYSMDEHEKTPIPKIMQMYFQYENQIPYKKRAVLYHNIIAGRGDNPQIYEQYRKNIGRFAMEQVEKLHIDENLAVIYEDMLQLGLIDHELAHCLARILYTHKLEVSNDRMVRVHMYQRQMKNPQSVSIRQGQAYIQLFSRDYVVIFEDAEGRRYADGVEYTLDPLMNAQAYEAACAKLAPEEIPYIVSYLERKENHLELGNEDRPMFAPILFSEELAGSYKSRMIPEILHFYRKKREDGTVQEYLKTVKFQDFSVDSRKFFLELMVEYRMCDQAYERIQEYGMDQIGPSSKAVLAIERIGRHEMEEDFLTELCVQAFLEGKYNDTLLEYLCRYYNGPTDRMHMLWKAADGFGINTFELEERILTQMLFSDQWIPDIEPLFYKYYGEGGRELVVMAFLSVVSHEYFLRDRAAGTEVFEILESRYAYRLGLNDICRLALLKHLSGKKELSNTQYKIADELLLDFTSRNMVFAFYKKFDHALILKYHLYDKVILEYRTGMDKHVVLHYSGDEDEEEFHTEDMVNVYEGIFVTQFVMFFGEMIRYYITEEKEGQVVVVQNSRLVNSNIYNLKDNSRFHLINQMLMTGSLMEEEQLIDYMNRYVELDDLTKKAFKLL